VILGVSHTRRRKGWVQVSLNIFGALLRVRKQYDERMLHGSHSKYNEKVLHVLPDMLTRDLFAVANLLVSSSTFGLGVTGCREFPGLAAASRTSLR